MKVIQDKFHGNIEISDLEAFFLKHPLVNRLHHVLQNSMVYQVFPCCKTSRFEHSLGVMHLSGKVYNAGLNNSRIRNEFIEDMRVKIIGLFDDEEEFFKMFELNSNSNHDMNEYERNSRIKTKYENISKLLDSEDTIKAMHLILGTQFVDRNLNNASSNRVTENNSDTLINLLLFQMTRMHGLLHDIGHLPFSHLFEFAISNILNELTSKKIAYGEASLNQKELKILKYTKEIINYKEPTKANESSDKHKEPSGHSVSIEPHENLGKNITTILIRSARQVFTDYCLKNENEFKKENLYSVLAIFSLIEALWGELKKTHGGICSPIYSIVSSPLDSDKLDYVRRDCEMSGISKFSGNIPRLVNHFVLVKIKDKSGEMDKDKFRFIPSIQSLNDAEDVLHSRFLVYKNLVNHHAVKRADTILQTAIEISLRIGLEPHKETAKTLENGSVLTTATINQDLESLTPLNIGDLIRFIYKVITTQKDKYREATYLFSQVTDYWLLSFLTGEYVRLNLKERDERTTDEEKLHGLLRELFESKRKYKSLWKRLHQYEKFVIEFAELYLENYGKKLCDKLLSKKFSGVEPTQQLYGEYEDSGMQLNQEFLFMNLLKNYGADIKEVTRVSDLNVQSHLKFGMYIYKSKVDEAIKLNNDELIYIGNALISYLNLKNENWVSVVENNMRAEGVDTMIVKTRMKPGISISATNRAEQLFFTDIKNQEDIHDLSNVSPIQSIIKLEFEKAIRFYVYASDVVLKPQGGELAIKKFLCENVIKLFNNINEIT